MTGRRGLACPGYCWVHGPYSSNGSSPARLPISTAKIPRLPRDELALVDFEGDDQSHIDTGIVVSADRAVAEAAANDAIERRKQEAR
jgi:hypothetical protein